MRSTEDSEAEQMQHTRRPVSASGWLQSQARQAFLSMGASQAGNKQPHQACRLARGVRNQQLTLTVMCSAALPAMGSTMSPRKAWLMPLLSLTASMAPVRYSAGGQRGRVGGRWRWQEAERGPQEGGQRAIRSSQPQPCHTCMLKTAAS